MSEIVIDVGYLQKYLRDIVRELNGIKFETTCFDMTGNISGLNAYVYAYSRISNFLVGYRSFARADIQNMCQCIEELINTDSELANTISGDSVELLISLNNDIGSISDAEGALSLPSIYTSSYILNYEDMSRFNQIYTEQVSELLSHILGYRNWIEALCDSGAIQGDMANAIISYWNEVHIPIVDVVSRIVLEIKDRYSDFVNEIDTLITEREDCNIPQCQLEGSMDEIYSLLNRIRLVSEGITGLVQSYYNSYSQFTSSNPNAELLIDMMERTISEIQVLDESIIDYENNQASLIKDYVDNAINEMNSFINGIQSMNQSEYESGNVSQFSGYDYVSDISLYINLEIIEQRLVDMYIEIADENIDNLSYSQINIIRNYINNIATNRYQDTANVLQLREEYPYIISRYVQAYELLNPDQARLIRNFMSPIADAATESNGYVQDMENILYILYTADEPYRSVYINSTRRISLDNINYDGLARYITKTRSIYLNVVKLREESIPYLTFFHELGHGIDDVSAYMYLINPPVSSNRNYVNCEGKLLKELVIEELSENIRVNLISIVYDNELNVNEDELNALLEHIISRNYIHKNYYPSEWTPAMRLAFIRFRELYGYHIYSQVENRLIHEDRVIGILESLPYAPLSDVFGAITNNEIGGRSGHYMDEESELISADMQPNISYRDDELADYLTNYQFWYSSSGINNSISSEFFAEYSAHCVYDLEGYAEAYNQITPLSAMFINEFYESLL